MMSFTKRINSLSILSEYFLKSEPLYCGFNAVFTRTLVTNIALLTRNFMKKIDALEYRKPLNTKKHLGEIIDLNVEFDEVKMDNEKSKNKRKLGEISPKLTGNVKVDSSVEKTEASDSSHTRKENNVEESGKSSLLKGKFSDLKQNSKIFSSAMISLRSSKLRKKEQKIILEGKRLIHDAISAGFSPSKVFFSRLSDLEKLGLPENTHLYKVPHEKFKLWGDVVTPQGVMAIFEMPKLSNLKNRDNTIPLTIICDNIRDPGNLGTILRIAASVGCEKLILIKGCADIWGSKVLRAAAGAHFRLPVLNNVQWTDVRSEIHEESKIILADFNNCVTCNEDSENKNEPKNMTSSFRSRNEMSESLPIHCYYSVEYGKESAVIIVGGEAQGISNEAYEFGVERKGIRVFIPMNNDIESLNSSVALGILTYDFRRQFDFICGKEIPVQDIGGDNPKN